MGHLKPSLFILASFVFAASSLAADFHGGMVKVPGGSYTPFFSTAGSSPPPQTQVQSFWIDIYPITNRQFRDFVRQHPEWGKSRVKSIFADGHYLSKWRSDDVTEPAKADQPVTDVSWFAAKAYCKAQGKSLPTTDQWEYALADEGRERDSVRNRTIAWYSKPNSSQLATVGSTPKNGFGIYDLTGLIWEWTSDFSNFALAGPRDLSGKEQGFFCGAGSAGANDSRDSGAFMRYSMRASLKASYTTDNLGFRCATEGP